MDLFFTIVLTVSSIFAEFSPVVIHYGVAAEAAELLRVIDPLKRQ
jgi:hypothetical protein